MASKSKSSVSSIVCCFLPLWFLVISPCPTQPISRWERGWQCTSWLSLLCISWQINKEHLDNTSHHNPMPLDFSLSVKGKVILDFFPHEEVRLSHGNIKYAFWQGGGRPCYWSPEGVHQVVSRSHVHITNTWELWWQRSLIRQVRIWQVRQEHGHCEAGLVSLSTLTATPLTYSNGLVHRACESAVS